MLQGPVFSKFAVPLDEATELITQAGFSPIVSEDGSLLVSFFSPKSPEFYRNHFPDSAQLIAAKDGDEYRLTVAGIYFLANSMRLASEA